jgi:hypothetical protein
MPPISSLFISSSDASLCYSNVSFKSSHFFLFSSARLISGSKLEHILENSWKTGSTKKWMKPTCVCAMFTVCLSHSIDIGRFIDLSKSPWKKNSLKRRSIQREHTSHSRHGLLMSDKCSACPSKNTLLASSSSSLIIS